MANSQSTLQMKLGFGSKTEQWRFDEGPAENTTRNLIFDTVHSFLQHWPNSRYRHGHNIVPGVIPTGTLLYHGTGRNMHLTPATTRSLKGLYFDGSSAAKVAEDTMDTQDIIAGGEVHPGRFYARASLANLSRYASVELVSFLYIRLFPEDENPFPRFPPSPAPLESDARVRRFEVMHSGSWHNRYPGDSRIVLDLTGLVSLYDITLAPSPRGA
ncbi:uncharacterized protein F5891DRAFT_1258675 [Suillus fuscotomentosus]|uniref:Uncharacterized protein n=1 Tax=Suillus fuscotomentosus TaxID=1912939 RepID=A0AAD4DTJ4_9AGAM|nr:uncharacterized protein F5891DRAFT_1258675 [Suillus fuscotomentosus]KAG1893596.1 hypothetical protein F5891DRAFT_1258675 [Suillus fuscotomentosus]